MEENLAKMICAYCFKERQPTKEHIIPYGIINLFPECELAFRSGEWFLGEAVIKDVCEDCNNNILGDLDAYGKGIIEEYFVREYEHDSVIEVEFDHSLLSRWLFKILYNSDRSKHLDVDWFIKNINYIMGITNQVSPFSLFGGLTVNTSPMAAWMMNNVQMRIINNPQFIVDGIIQPVYGDGLSYRFNRNFETLEISEIYKQYLIQFGSVLFILLLWKDNISNEKIETYEKGLQLSYPYTLINEIGKITLKRCTHAFNYFTPQLMDSNVGIEIADSTNCFYASFEEPIGVNKKMNKEWEQHVRKIREKHVPKRKKKKSKRKK